MAANGQQAVDVAKIRHYYCSLSPGRIPAANDKKHVEQMLKAVLEQLDNMLKYSAVRQGWEIKHRHERVQDTIVGQIRFNRRYYKRLTATGEYIYSHLLDEVLGLEKGKNLSPRLSEMAASLAAENSYRSLFRYYRMLKD